MTKTRKTLKKRIKITKGGKVISKQLRTGHLKRKWSSNKKHRKNKRLAVVSKGYRSKLKKLMGKSKRTIA